MKHQIALLSLTLSLSGCGQGETSHGIVQEEKPRTAVTLTHVAFGKIEKEEIFSATTAYHGKSVDYAIALRIRPKLMTAAGAVLALMPLALGVGLGAQMQQPLAVAVIGGFVVGLPLLLLVLPCTVLLIYKEEETVVWQK